MNSKIDIEPAKLNAQQDRFCQEYVQDYNGTKAATRAGYSERSAAVTATRLLKNANILARIRKLQAETVKRLAISEDRIIESLWETYNRCMTAEPVMGFNYTSKQMEPTGEYAFDSKGAIKALESVSYTHRIEASSVLKR